MIEQSRSGLVKRGLVCGVRCRGIRLVRRLGRRAIRLGRQELRAQHVSLCLLPHIELRVRAGHLLGEGSPRLLRFRMRLLRAVLGRSELLRQCRQLPAQPTLCLRRGARFGLALGKRLARPLGQIDARRIRCNAVALGLGELEAKELLLSILPCVVLRERADERLFELSHLVLRLQLREACLLPRLCRVRLRQSKLLRHGLELLAEAGLCGSRPEDALARPPHLGSKCLHLLVEPAL